MVDCWKDVSAIKLLILNLGFVGSCNFTHSNGSTN